MTATQVLDTFKLWASAESNQLSEGTPMVMASKKSITHLYTILRARRILPAKGMESLKAK